MQSGTRELLIELTRPVYVTVRFLVRLLDKVLLGWLYIIWQRRADRSLEYDIRTNVTSIFPEGKVIKERWYRLLPFDFAAVRVLFKNICIHFARGQDQLNVSISPSRLSEKSYELAVVLAALDSADVRDQEPTPSLSKVDDVLRNRLNELNDAFSEENFPAFKLKLSEAKHTIRVMAKEAEWELNRRLYH